MILFFSIFPVDFVKFFQNGDNDFHQEMELKYSTDDVHHGYVGQETSECAVRDEKNYCENTLSFLNITCPGNM